MGEIIIYDIDDTHNYERIKIGDGVSVVTELPFYQEDVELITVDDIDAICGTTIQDASNSANEVTF